MSADNFEYWFQWPIAEREPIAACFDHQSLATLPLSTRAYNGLRRAAIYKSVGDVMRTDDSVQHIRHLGRQSLAEIHAILEPVFAAARRHAVGAEGRRTEVSFADSVRALSTLPPFEAAPWFSILLIERIVFAGRYQLIGLDQFRLSEPAARELRQRTPFRTISQIIAIGPRIRDEYHLERATLHEFHQCLRLEAQATLRQLGVLEALDQRLARLRKLPTTQQWTFHDLCWPHYVATSLAKQGITTVGELIRHDSTTLLIASPSDQPTATLAELLDEIIALANDDSLKNWIELQRRHGLQVIPDRYTDRDSMPLAVALHETIRGLIEAMSSPKDWDIVRHRHGLLGAPEFTLQQVGKTLGITRERVRQREKRALASLRHTLRERHSLTYTMRIHPDIVQTLDQLDALFDDVQRHPTLESEFRSRSNAIIERRQSQTIDPAVILLAELSHVGRDYLGSTRLEALWCARGSNEVARLAKWVKLIDDHLNGTTAAPLTELELVVRLNEQLSQDEQVTLATVKESTPYCSSIERTTDGRIQGRFECLRTRSLRFERALREAGEPLHYLEIARIVNHRAAQAGKRLMTRDNLGNILAADDRFMPVGRSGYWALCEWTQVETGTVVNLMERCLTEHNRPMTVEEIHSWVSNRRPVSRSSVSIYITRDERFARTDHDHWGLAHWKEAREALVWDRDRVADFVADQFRQRETGQLPYDHLCDELQRAAGVSEQASHVLLHNPALRIEKGADGLLFVRLHRDYRKRLSIPEDARRKKGSTIRQQIADRAIQLLSEQESTSLPLQDLRDRMEQEFGVPRATVYSYLARIEDLEKVSVPGRGIIVHLRMP